MKWHNRGLRQSIRLRPPASGRSYLIPGMALAFGLGVWLAPHVAAGWWPLWLLPAIALFGLALRWLRLPLRWLLCPLMLVLALLWTQLWLHPAMPAEGEYGVITATVYGEPTERSGNRIALTLCNVVLDGQPQAGRAYCTLNEDEDTPLTRFFDGAQLRFEGEVYHPSGKQNAFDFDFRMWLLQNGMEYGISGVKTLEVLNTPDTAPWTSAAARIRAFCQQRFDRLLGEQSGLAMAMLLGDRETLSAEDQLAFQQAGVAHLMSVSGLHVGLLALALLWLLTTLALRPMVRLPVMALFLLGYCALTGFSPASVRATVMMLLVLIGKALGRRNDPLITLCAAAIAVLWINPLQLFSAGFTLSFAAMLGILLLYAPILQCLKSVAGQKPQAQKTSRFSRLVRLELQKLRQTFAVSLAAQVGVLLPTAAYFYRLPLYGMAFNLLCVPLAGLLVPLYAIVLLLSLVPAVGLALATAPGLLAQGGSWALLWLVRLAGSLPYAQIRVPAPNVWAYAGLAVAVVAASRYVRAGWRRRALAVALSAAIAVTGAALAKPSALRYHQFAVGQGDAALMIDGDRTVAIDVGPYGAEMGERLLAEGRDLDALLLTHLHADHVQGLQELLNDGIVIRHIYLPVSAEPPAASAEGQAMLALIQASGAPVTYLAAGDSLAFHNLTIRVLWPETGRTRAGLDENERSMATLVQLGKLRILSMADNSALYEQYFAVPCDVLKVGHHGSKDGSADAFLKVASPTYALVTCRSGAALPNPDTLARLETHGAKILRTDETGEIVIEAVGDGYRARTYLAEGTDEP